jgi:hypothetical protein
MRTLYEFLISLLPAALVAKAGGFSALVVAAVQLLKVIPWFSARKKLAAPIAAFLLGQLAGWATIQFAVGQWLTAVGLGMVVFLVAVGAVETVKNGSQIAEQRSRNPAA